jgi:hypothetical protein
MEINAAANLTGHACTANPRALHAARRTLSSWSVQTAVLASGSWLMEQGYQNTIPCLTGQIFIDFHEMIVFRITKLFLILQNIYKIAILESIREGVESIDFKSRYCRG